MASPLEMLIVAGLISGFYAILAVGFTLVLAVAGVENLTHGAYALIGAYTVLVLTRFLGLPNMLAYPLAVLVGAGSSVATFKGLIRHIQGDPIRIFVMTLVLAVCVEQIIALAFTGTVRAIEPLISGNIEVLGIRISLNLVLAFFIAWTSIGALAWFVKKTYLGRAIVCTSMDRKGAILVGVDTEKIYIATFAIAGGLAALAGTLYGSYTMVYPHMWVFPLIISFVIVMFGGIGSIMGTVLAAIIIGFSETAMVYLVAPVFKGVIGLVMVMIMLLVRPQGLFGREEIF